MRSAANLIWDELASHLAQTCPRNARSLGVVAPGRRGRADFVRRYGGIRASSRRISGRSLSHRALNVDVPRRRLDVVARGDDVARVRLKVVAGDADLPAHADALMRELQADAPCRPVPTPFLNSYPLRRGVREVREHREREVRLPQAGHRDGDRRRVGKKLRIGRLLPGRHVDAGQPGRGQRCTAKVAGGSTPVAYEPPVLRSRVGGGRGWLGRVRLDARRARRGGVGLRDHRAGDGADHPQGTASSPPHGLDVGARG